MHYLRALFTTTRMIIRFVVLPLIAAFIGWFTNYIAIKMLFHPKEPMRFLGMTIQGIFPKRQKQFAIQLGNIVAKELLSFDEIAASIKDPSNLEVVKPTITNHVDVFLNEKLKEKIPVIAMFASPAMIETIKIGLMEEIDLLLPEVIAGYVDNMSSKMNIEQMVAEKVAGFSSDKLEELLIAIMSKEFKFVEIVGGVLGLLIGIIQSFITLI